MNNFTYFNPVRLVFGKDTIPQLADLIPADRKVLITYGGGSIKKNGVYDQVKKALANHTVLEFGGIEANPRYETCMRAVELAKKENVGFLLAVGGGSVLDATKFIAAAIRFEGSDPWDILSRNAKVTSAVPLGSVLTLPATGSEMNTFAVISRESTQEKLAFGSEHVYPKFSILDPTTTYSLPIKQVRNGIVDAFVHVAEQYLTYPASGAVQDRQAEAVWSVLIEEGPKTLKNPTDYDARANLVWAATQALNGLISCGVPGDWGTHAVGHEVTAFYGLDHAETLAIVLPSMLRYQLPKKQAKLATMARRVWGVQESDDRKAAETAITKIEEFFHSLGMPTRFADYKISPDEAATKIRDRFTQRNTKIGERGDLLPDHVAAILKAS